MLKTKLSPKQQAFCEEYIITLNATQAAIRAGYSSKTAKQIGCENLSKPYLKEYIEIQLRKKQSSLIATQDEVLSIISEILRENGNKPTERLKAAELLGKYYNIYDKNHHEDSELPQILMIEGITEDDI